MIVTSVILTLNMHCRSSIVSAIIWTHGYLHPDAQTMDGGVRQWSTFQTAFVMNVRKLTTIHLMGLVKLSVDAVVWYALVWNQTAAMNTLDVMTAMMNLLNVVMNIVETSTIRNVATVKSSVHNISR